MHAEVNVFSNSALSCFGCKLIMIVNQLKYGGEKVWNHLQIWCSVSISCFKDLVDQENYLFFSNLFFLLFSIVFLHQKHSGHFQCFCGIVSVLQFLCFLWVTWFWKQTSKQLKTNTIKRKKWCLCAVWSKDSHQIVATVLICNSPNFIGKVLYLHNNHPFFFLPAMALYKQEKNQIRQTSDHYVSLSDKWLDGNSPISN